MTWEMPDSKFRRFLSPSLFLGAVAVVSAIFFFRGGEATEKSFAESCEEQQGELLTNASQPTCIFKGGQKIVFGNPPPGIVTATDETSVNAVATCDSAIGVDEAPRKIAAPDFSSWPDAEKYRTAIRKDVGRGINAAGSYIVASWGMPSSESRRHIGYAVVDGQTGEILRYETDVYAVDFSKSSSVVTVQSPQGSEGYFLHGGRAVLCE